MTTVPLLDDKSRPRCGFPASLFAMHDLDLGIRVDEVTVRETARARVLKTFAKKLGKEAAELLIRACQDAGVDKAASALPHHLEAARIGLEFYKALTGLTATLMKVEESMDSRPGTPALREQYPSLFPPFVGPVDGMNARQMVTTGDAVRQFIHEHRQVLKRMESLRPVLALVLKSTTAHKNAHELAFAAQVKRLTSAKNVKVDGLTGYLLALSFGVADLPETTDELATARAELKLQRRKLTEILPTEVRRYATQEAQVTIAALEVKQAEDAILSVHAGVWKMRLTRRNKLPKTI